MSEQPDWIAEEAEKYHRTIEGEYGCPGQSCQGVQRLVAEFRAVAERAVQEERERTGWQPIETAPKDGRAVIGFDPSRESEWLDRIEFMRWVDGSWLDPATHRMRPTHWMPLPEPPR